MKKQPPTSDIRNSLSVLYGELSEDLEDLNKIIHDYKRVAPNDESEDLAHFNAAKAIRHFMVRTSQLSKKYDMMIAEIANNKYRAAGTK